MGCSLRAYLRIACLAVAANHLAFVAGQYCYYPSGPTAEKALDQFPCDEHAYTTFCCPAGWTCFSNKLCVATDPTATSSYPLGTVIRGTCTNPNWDTDACGDFCRHDPVDANNGSIIACGNNNFCCQPDSASGLCDCNTGKNTFQLPDGTAQTIIGVTGLAHTSTGTVIPSSTSSSSPTTTGSSSLSTTSSSTSSISSSKASTTNTPPSSSTGTGSANPSETNAAPVPTTQTKGFKIAMGTVFSFIGLGIIFFLIFWFYIRPRRQSGSQQSHEPINAVWAEDAVASPHPMAMPVPHPYEEPHNLSSRNVAEIGLAPEPGAFRRNTPGPFEPISEEHNPYSENFRQGR